MNNNLFDCLNWISRKKNIDIENSPTSFYMLNRWISMIDKDHCKIINNTVNKWISKNNSFNDDFYILKFLKQTLPKQYKKINYIKKNNKKDKEEKNEDFFVEIANSLNISQKELKNNFAFLKEIYDNKT